MNSVYLTWGFQTYYNLSYLIRVLSHSKPHREAPVSSQIDAIVTVIQSPLLCGVQAGSVIPIHWHSSTREPAELNNALGFVSLILSLISPNSSWQGSCQAISGNKNSLHTSLLIFPLLCLLLKCFPLPLLKKQHCNYWKLALPPSVPPGPRAWLMPLGGEGPGAGERVPTLSSSSELVIASF